MTISDMSDIKLSSIPNFFANLIALLMTLLSTYPLPSLLGTTPSAVRNVELRECSATALIA